VKIAFIVSSSCLSVDFHASSYSDMVCLVHVYVYSWFRLGTQSVSKTAPVRKL
jgi:hypothetical protein